MAISVVILAYKEEENLKILLPQVKEKLEQIGEKYEILIIDAAKPADNTKAVCEELGARYINQRYPNFGGAYRTGIEEAQFDKFLIMDADFSHDPKYIPDIYNLYRTGADVVIGSRYTKGGETHDAASSIFMSKVLNFVFRIIIGIKAKDISTDFRMYDTAQLKKITLKCQNYDIVEEILFKMKLNNKKLVIKETPISFQKRKYGESKRRLIPFIWGYIKTMFRFIGIRISSAFSKNK